MRNTADVTGKPIAVFLQSISGGSAINPLVVYNIHGGKREVLFRFVPDTTRDILLLCSIYLFFLHDQTVIIFPNLQR
jgi:hypothetical protein